MQRSARSSPDGDLGRVRARELREAAAVARHRRGDRCCDHPDGDLRWADVPELHAEIVAAIERYRPDARDHVRRGRPVLAPRSHRRPRADLHGGAVVRRRRRRRSTTSRCRTGVMREVVEAAHAKGGAPPDSSFWGIEPDAFGDGAKPPTFVDRRARLGAAQAGRAALPSHADGARTTRSPGSTTTRRGAGSASSSSAARRSSADRAIRCIEQLGEPVSPCMIAARSTSSAARTAADGSTLVTSLFHRTQRRRDPGRHPRLPVLHLPGRRRHSGAAPAAGRRPRRAITSRRAGPDLARRAMFGLDDDEQAERVRRASPRPTRATYRDIVEALGPNFEGGYFLYRFSDPTYIVGARRGPRRGRHGARRRRARDRHLRRIGTPDAIAAGSVVAAAGARRSVLREDLAGAALHRAGLRAGVLRRQRADAVRARRVRLRDVLRRVHVHLDEAAVRRRDGAAGRRHGDDAGRRRSSATPTTSCTWSPSHGQPLTPDGYRDLFETIEPRLFGEAGLFADVVAGGPLDLSRRDDRARRSTPTRR